MSTRNARFMAAVTGVLLCWTCVPAQGQAIFTGQTAAQNLAIALSDSHRPGSMVISGLARAQSAVRNPGVPFEITETTPPRSFAEEARIEVFTVALEELLGVFNFILVQYLQREGFTVSLPDDTTPPADGDGTDGRNGGRGDSTPDGGKGPGRKSVLAPRTMHTLDPVDARSPPNRNR